MTTTATPAIRVIGTCWRSSSAPTAVADSPKRTNTTENPATNSAPVRTGRRSSAPAPAVSDRYAGTSGSTHGDRNETIPPPKASTNPAGDTCGAYRSDSGMLGLVSWSAGIS
jgi:hypothetical protein